VKKNISNFQNEAPFLRMSNVILRQKCFPMSQICSSINGERREGGRKFPREESDTEGKGDKLLRERSFTFKNSYVTRFGWFRCIMFIGESFSIFSIKCFIFLF